MFKLEELYALSGQLVSVAAFVEVIRIQGKIGFLILRSNGQYLQTVLSGDVLQQARQISPESYVRVKGLLVVRAEAPGGHEIQVQSLELLSRADTLPIEEDSKLGLQLDHPVARFRRRREALILKTASVLEQAMRAYLYQHDFTEIHSPKLMASPSESGAEVFRVSYFGETAYLAQSPQFYKQMAIVSGLEKVFEIGPVFRAEQSFSSRHATEFISVDVEMEGVSTAEELVAFECAMLIQSLTQVCKTLGTELSTHFPAATVPASHAVLKFAEAQAMLGLSGEEALNAAQEKELGQLMQARGVELLALTAVPYRQRPFYHMREGLQSTHSFELLYRGVEITTGAIREHRHAQLLAQLQEKSLSGQGAESYLDAFRYGAPPHGGFGLGLARLVSLFLGLSSIKEAVFIHRDPARLTP
jgi:aspartyl/asparaginyl-tRNA synthetase